jgi:uncharacterized protein (TIGR04255 family)
VGTAPPLYLLITRESEAFLDLTPEDRLPEYENPPVAEVVTGVYFRKIPLQLPHFGLLWKQFQHDYPRFEEAPPLITTIEQSDTPDFPMPRVWFLSRDETGVIQVQNSYFLANWRRVKADDAYPRYHRVMEQYRDRLGRFSAFLESQSLPEIEPVHYEMTYVNHIPQGDGWNDLGDIGRVLPDLSWRKEPVRFFSGHETLNCVWGFSLPKGMGRLRVSVKTARRRADDVPVLIMELTAKGKPEASASLDAWNWYSVAREWIVRGFADLTSSEVQETVWKRTG